VDVTGCATFTSTTKPAIGAPIAVASTADTRSLFVFIDEYTARAPAEYLPCSGQSVAQHTAALRDFNQAMSALGLSRPEGVFSRSLDHLVGAAN
jgi:hypothetical protein